MLYGAFQLPVGAEQNIERGEECEDVGGGPGLEHAHESKRAR